MGVASQEWLDATRGGAYATPAAWEALAASWQASGVPIEDAERWIEAGVNSSAMAVQAISAGLTPEDAERIGPWLKAQNPLPALAYALCAAAVMRALAAEGLNTSSARKQTLLENFFAEMGALNIDVGET